MYDLSCLWSVRGKRAAEDEEAAPDTSGIDYYINGIGEAFDYLAGYLQEVSAMEREVARSPETLEQLASRADLAKQWVDAIENDRLSKSQVSQIIESLQARGHILTMQSTRSGMIKVLRDFISEINYRVWKAIQNSGVAPW